VSIDLRAMNDLLLAQRPVPVSYSVIASIFFGVGVSLVIAEAMFFEYFQAMANSSFTTRHVIGFHLFPSEIWFIFLGNLLLFLAIANKSFEFPTYLVIESRPVFLVLGVYSLWFVYGSLAGNSWALQEFREMVFTALSLPPILYFASLLSARSVFEKFVLPGSLLLLVLAVFDTPNTALIVSTFFVSYLTLTLLYKNAWAIVGLGLVSLPFLLKFAKPMIVLFAFCVTASFLLAGYLNPKSVNWILSKFKMRIVFIALSIFLGLVAVVAIINAWTGGAIEEIIRFYFLKERLTAAGQTVYADVSGGRFAIWRSALESWTQRPFVGFGLGSEVEAYSTGWVTKVQFHSYVIQALHHTGLIGLLLIAGGWITWLLRTTRKVFAVRDVNEKIVLGAMLVYVFGIFFYGLYGHSLTYPPSTQFFWLCVGFLCALRRPVHYRVRL